MMMRTTHVKPADYQKMIKYAEDKVGTGTGEIVFGYEEKFRCSKAGKVFWDLVDDGVFCVKKDEITSLWILIKVDVTRFEQQ